MEPTLLLTIRNNAIQGEKILGYSWRPFIESLREELSQHGIEQSLSTDEQLVFTFTGHYTAFSAIFSSLEKSKQAIRWRKASGPSPIQFIIDLFADNTLLSKASLPDPGLWNGIEQETIYLGGKLQEIWPNFASQKSFPSHELNKMTNGLAKITFTNNDIGKQKTLLAYRALPVSQKGPECFYCGMTTHHPSQCPSKMLGMDSWGLNEIGYLSFEEINTLYKKVFPEKTAIVAKLSPGVKTINLRKDKELLVFVSFFDLSVIFQLRFLWNYAFSTYSKWKTIYQTDKVKIDNRNLHLGFDCLRVGQYEQAEEFLQNELKRHDENKFTANIGLAFLSMERNRNSDISRYLETARNHAKSNTDSIYINLILSRHFEIVKDFWSAKEAVSNALKADYDCLDIQYRRIQLSVRENNINDREFKQLHSFIVGQKDIFIRSLLDPTLLPIQGLLNETLTHQYKTIAFDAAHNLKGAASEVKKLSIWLEDKDKREIANNQTIQELRTQFEQKSYFHQLDVSEKANGLFFTCRRLRKNQTDQLTEELTRYQRQLDTFLKFWKSYQHKNFNKTFRPTIIQALNNCKKSIQLLKDNSSKASRKAIELSRKIKTDYKDIKKEYSHLLLLRTIVNGLQVFVKKLLICEGTGLLIMALTFPAINATLGNNSSFDWLIQITTNSDIQTKSMFVTALLVAPFLALAWSLLELQKE